MRLITTLGLFAVSVAPGKLVNPDPYLILDFKEPIAINPSDFTLPVAIENNWSLRL